jgi:hypothetical protein
MGLLTCWQLGLSLARVLLLGVNATGVGAGVALVSAIWCGASVALVSAIWCGASVALVTAIWCGASVALVTAVIRTGAWLGAACATCGALGTLVGQGVPSRCALAQVAAGVVATTSKVGRRCMA